MPEAVSLLDEVTGIIDRVFGTSTRLEAKYCLLGLVEGAGNPGSIQTAVLRCLFKARKLISLRWQSVLPPSSREWSNSMNVVILKEKPVYIKQGTLRKYDNMWKPWWEARGIDM